MVANPQPEMARTRALLTERERKVIAGEEGDTDDLRYVRWEVANRIEDEIPDDIAILAEHEPDLLNKLRKEICDGNER